MRQVASPEKCVKAPPAIFYILSNRERRARADKDLQGARQYVKDFNMHMENWPSRLKALLC